MVDENKGTQDSGGQSDKQGSANAPGDYVPKTEFDKVSQQVNKMQQDLEDARLEMMSPEYLEFLSSKSGKKEEAPKDPPVSDDEFSKMTPKQIYERAKSEAVAEANAKIDELKKSDETRTKDNIQKDIRQFAASHSDYEDYRPTMYGLSINPKYKDFSLQQLYDESKAIVKRLSGTPSPEEKAKVNRTKGEKPGGSSGTYTKHDKSVTADQAANDAWEEVVGDSNVIG